MMNIGKIKIKKIYLIILVLIGILVFKNSREKLMLSLIRVVRNTPNKCYLHRVNSLEKLLELSEKYKGIEVDLNFNKEKLFFDITHDSEESINLSLEEFFLILEKNNKKIWLDLKNLSKENSKECLTVLNNLVKKYSFDKERLILESNNLEELKIFKTQGYYVSYYIPYLRLNEMTEKERIDWKNKLKKIAENKEVSALSFPGYLYEFVKEINTNIDLLTWESGLIWEKLFLNETGRKMLKDKQLKILNQLHQINLKNLLTWNEKKGTDIKIWK